MKKYTDYFETVGHYEFVDTDRRIIPEDQLLGYRRRDAARSIGAFIMEKGMVQETVTSYTPGAENHPGLRPGIKLLEHQLVVMRPGTGSLNNLIREIQVEAIREWEFSMNGKVWSDGHIAGWLQGVNL